MAQSEISLAGTKGASIDGSQLDRSGPSSRSKPEEGHRLMRAFVSIRQAALREAIVKFVDELSTLRDDNREP